MVRFIVCKTDERLCMCVKILDVFLTLFEVGFVGAAIVLLPIKKKSAIAFPSYFWLRGMSASRFSRPPKIHVKNGNATVVPL